MKSPIDLGGARPSCADHIFNNNIISLGNTKIAKIKHNFETSIIVKPI